jgi:hypothetical protein
MGGDPMSPAENHSTLKSMMLPVGIALVFIAWGLMVFFTVGDKKVHQWHFGELPDVPGQSPYSTERKARDTGAVPRELKERIPPQHIDGRTDPTNPYLKGAPDGSP